MTKCVFFFLEATRECVWTASRRHRAHLSRSPDSMSQVLRHVRGPTSEKKSPRHTTDTVCAERGNERSSRVQVQKLPGLRGVGNQVP